MWVTDTLSIGDVRCYREFPIRVAYDRDLGGDVTLEIDVAQIGEGRDERIARTEEVGGRATSTRFVWSYIVRMPRTVTREEEAVAWLRRTFAAIFRVAFASSSRR